MLVLNIILMALIPGAPAATVSSVYNKDVLKKSCMQTQAKPADVFKKYKVKVIGFNKKQRKQIAAVLDVFSKDSTPKQPQLINASLNENSKNEVSSGTNTASSLFANITIKQVKSVRTLNGKRTSCVGAGRYRGDGKKGVITMGQKKPRRCGKRSGKKIPFNVTRLAHEYCHHIGHYRGDGHNHDGSTQQTTAKKTGSNKKNYGRYPGTTCHPKGSTYGAKKRNENFAELCAAYWVHPEAIAHCPKHVKFFKGVFGKRSPCSKNLNNVGPSITNPNQHKYNNTPVSI